MPAPIGGSLFLTLDHGDLNLFDHRVIESFIAAVSELAACTREPTQSQPIGTPTHSTRLPMNMIATSRAALSNAGSSRRARSISGSRGPLTCA